MGWRLPRASPIFVSMSWFPRPSSPRAAFQDLAAFMRQSSREQRIGAALAFLVTAIIVIEFLVDAKIDSAPPQEVTYVQLYPTNRTDADIVADQKKDMAAKQAAEKERQRQFQKLEKQLGM
jgi:ethanolamine utilization microcompartment shell protein EutL